ncbi:MULTISPECIES: amidohydrolase [Mammaliicoccus]|uniref:Amidohydrolase n=1 Tax=Mammaliicoccus fleurettii TaxID=150056 RepID=A0ABS5MK36_9STAP|nr:MULTISPECIES: amidohydrolase [Mammaliicoccus]MBL0846056.1 amidohydrolase [Mammaliicoccus fleurettii]MBS3671342.1 amidohydrolase [Mammaliicoccus fleurettii]MBS3696283.1 amidohydrolase [Mammaliicoccus fleurettii]MBW0764699.1 N-acetyldiaminopimelate deacetylase [Mammaliicoccus fleurettii]MEB6200624.1 amidohydrolase [Mammaliicoccus fleurettii]
MSELEFVKNTRRYLHQHPELSMQEYETTAYIESFLNELDIPYERPISTGVIGYLKGNSNQTIAYRADIDALPIQEVNEISYKSIVDNVMHACGHDGHTTALMLFTKRCKALYDKGQLPHNVVFIYQPSEETEAGANQLIQSKVFDKYNIDKIYGIHIMPFEDVGTVAFKNDEITASATEYRFYLNGLSSHVASKEEGKAASEAMMHILSQVSQIQQFHLNGLNRNIVHIGQFNVGEAINTVPQNGYLEGTIRTYDTNDLQIVKDQMHKIAESVELLFSVTCSVKFAEGYPPTTNDVTLYKNVKEALTKLNLTQHELEKPYLFGEDFSFYRNIAPSYFVFFGTRNIQKDYIYGLHTNKLNFDEEVLISVADYYTALLTQGEID